MPDNILYASVGTLTKSRVDDGVLTFEASKATGPDLDADGQRVNMEWARTAMADWFDTGGNIREQHDAHRAVGKAMVLEEREDGLYTSGKVVDPVSIRKVEEGVLTGLSIGIRGGRVRNGEIIGGKIVELSLCDRPSNPTTKLVLAKAEGADGAFEAVEELIEDEKAERTEHSHTHQHSGAHHKHTHVHGPSVDDHRSTDPGIAHGHAHTADDPDVVADRAEDLSDADRSGNNKAEGIDTFVDVYGNLVEIPSMSKAVLSAADRQALPASDFAIPSKRPGSGSYPINDEAHARDALARSKGKPEESTVRVAVKRKYPDMEVDSDKSEQPEPITDVNDPTPINPTMDVAIGYAADTKSETPDIIKSITADPERVAELRKALGIDEAESDLREKVKSLEADLEKALDIDMLKPPARTAPAGAKAVSAAKSALEAKRDYYGHLADSIEDTELRKGYRDLAKAADADLQKIA